MAAPDRSETLQHADVLWERLRSTLDARIDERVDPAGWTGKDVFAHFARWTAVSIDSLNAILAGRPPVTLPGSDDDINDRWAAEDRALSAAVARQRCIDARATLRARLASLTQQQWDAFGHTFEDVTGPHYEHHLRAAETAIQEEEEHGSA